MYIKRFSQQQQKNQEGAPRFRAKNQTEARRHTSVLGRVGKAWDVVCMYRERASAILSIAEMPLPLTKKKHNTVSHFVYAINFQASYEKKEARKRQENRRQAWQSALNGFANELTVIMILAYLVRASQEYTESSAN